MAQWIRPVGCSEYHFFSFGQKDEDGLTRTYQSCRPGGFCLDGRAHCDPTAERDPKFCAQCKKIEEEMSIK